jgi:hypothetical protein
MEQSSKNINTYDVFMVEVKREINTCKNLKKNASVQTKINRNPKNNENKMSFKKKSYMHKIILETK